MYHVKCFEELLDLSSPHYVVRFESDQEKHMPDRGAQDILAEYISRWQHRREQGKIVNSDLPKSMGAGSGKETHPPSTGATVTALSDTAEQQVPASKTLAEPVVPKYVISASQLHIKPNPISGGPVAKLSSALKQGETPDVWAIADEIWERRTKAQAVAIQERNKLFGERSL